MDLEISRFWATVFVTTMVAAVTVGGYPILGPDLNSCEPIELLESEETYTCCLLDLPIKDFKFPANGPMRIRRPVHKVDAEFIKKYERAYEIQRSLPATDPRSHQAQADLHCSYAGGGGTYRQFNSTERLVVHFNWLFFPFHRWYLYFHERILASLIGDPTFVIPYWAWDVQSDTNPPANTMPSIFLDPNSSLYDQFRSASHMPPHGVDLEFYMRDSEMGPEKDPSLLNRTNIDIMWRAMIGEAQTPESFYGKTFVKDDPVRRGKGTFEKWPHVAVHGWTGDENYGDKRDMGSAYSSARDPIFWTHHSQVDRMWEVYDKMHGGRKFDDPDWLDAEFLFYDENAELVRVRIRDSLDLEKLGISYETLSAEWMDYSPLSLRQTGSRYARREETIVEKVWRNFCQLFNKVVPAEGPLESLVLGSSEEESKRTASSSRGNRQVLTTRVRRPLRVVGASILDELLILEGTITKPFHVAVTVHIFMDLPEANEQTPQTCAESLGRLHFPAEKRKSTEGTIGTSSFSTKIGIGPRYRILELLDATEVSITFVPAWDRKHDDSVRVQIMHPNLESHLDT